MNPNNLINRVSKDFRYLAKKECYSLVSDSLRTGLHKKLSLKKDVNVNKIAILNRFLMQTLIY